MNNETKLNELVTNGAIKSYVLINVDEDGNVGKTSNFRNTERLTLLFGNGESLTINTFCSGSAEDTVLIIS